MIMKKVFPSILIAIMFCGVSIADTVLFTSPETIDTPTAVKMEWEVTKINASQQILKVGYRWLDTNSKPIRDNDGRIYHVWTCRNKADSNPLTDAECTALGVPDECCTGAGTGDCDIVDTCFSDVFGFSIRQQDVGTSIGLGLRTLIWNQMKQDVLSGGNDGSFE